jgi:hypothetical protein
MLRWTIHPLFTFTLVLCIFVRWIVVIAKHHIGMNILVKHVSGWMCGFFYALRERSG